MVDADETDGLWWSSARELARQLSERRVSSVEVLEAHLERIEQHNPALNAVVSLEPDRARERTEAADAALARGEVWGPLHGVPMTLKDAHDVAGMRTTVGTEALDRVPTEDGVVAARLRGAGAIIVGHTNVPPGWPTTRAPIPSSVAAPTHGTSRARRAARAEGPRRHSPLG